MGYIISNIDCIKDGGLFSIENKHGFNLLTDGNIEVFHLDNIISFFTGYLVNVDMQASQRKVYEKFLRDIKINWPINDLFSGSYSSSTIYDNKIILANDIIGPYPLYYYIQDQKFIFTDNLQLVKQFIKIELDVVGIAQRLYAPENSAIGSRTILKNFKRLLPGEKLTFDLTSQKWLREYDNRLFGKIGDDKINAERLDVFGDRLKKEIDLIQCFGLSMDIALSGGLDSRLLLSVMSRDKPSACFTYGSSDSYESKIAKRLANSKGFKFISKTDYLQYFPDKNEIIDIIKNVETPYVMSWFEFLKDIPKSNNILLIGDMCEVLPARNIKKFSGRKDRKKNFFRHFVLNKPYKFVPSSKEAFEKWKKIILRRYLRDFNNLNLDGPLFINFPREKILNGIISDLDEIFGRIEEHNLKYVELYDELFAWYTHSRIPMGKQISHCNAKFKAISPSMGSGILILSSNIHPNSRMNYRFMNRLLKTKGFAELYKIPTNQSPIIPGTSPEIFRFLMWGFRSTVDQILIKRILRTKNPKLRYRLFKGINWVEIYQQKDVLKKFEAYFENNSLGEDIYEESKNELQARINLSSWPLNNVDILAPAILNLELESFSSPN